MSLIEMELSPFPKGRGDLISRHRYSFFVDNLPATSRMLAPSIVAAVQKPLPAEVQKLI